MIHVSSFLHIAKGGMTLVVLHSGQMYVSTADARVADELRKKYGIEFECTERGVCIAQITAEVLAQLI